jgi:hypothetical protein
VGRWGQWTSQAYFGLKTEQLSDECGFMRACLQSRPKLPSLWLSSTLWSREREVGWDPTTDRYLICYQVTDVMAMWLTTPSKGTVEEERREKRKYNLESEKTEG